LDGGNRSASGSGPGSPKPGDREIDTHLACLGRNSIGRAASWPFDGPEKQILVGLLKAHLTFCRKYGRITVKGIYYESEN